MVISNRNKTLFSLASLSKGGAEGGGIGDLGESDETTIST